MASPEGTDGEGKGCCGWFEVEAIVEKKTGDKISDDESDEEDEIDTDLDGFIDNSYIENIQADRETAQQLLQVQTAHADKQTLQKLKRKYIASPLSDISNQQTVCREGVKRRLILSDLQDSGYGNTLETLETQEQVDEEVQGRGCGNTQNGGSQNSTYSNNSEDSVIHMDINRNNETPTQQLQDLFKSSNLQGKLNYKFKEVYGIPFSELVRTFKSDSTCCNDWICAIFGVNETLAEALKTIIKPHCMYYHMQCLTCTWGVIVMMLIRYTCGKNRKTIAKALSSILNVPQEQMLIQPPKIRSPAVALYFYKTAMSNISDVYGDTPEWIQRQTQLQHSLQDSQFELSKMVQWAFDNDVTDDSQIAFQYAQLADVDSNAQAFLKSNMQAKYVKDCGIMCRHYKRAQQQQMNMCQWIKHICSKTDEGGDWKPIVQFLRYQGVDFISFLSYFKLFLQGTPKHNCLVLCGPPNTGKSCFAMSLIKFFQGSVISFVNSQSHFWLQPLDNAKLGLLDDATEICWKYIDDYLRNLVDGNPISLDRKHKQLVQIKCPPLLITTNINPMLDAKLRYLHSRMLVFQFQNPFPLDNNGNPVYELSNVNWKCFFTRTWSRLNLDNDEDKENNGDAFPTFKCVPEQNTRLF
ncbi:putative replication protein E1 [human papillomavirus 56]|uniref:Replication protein E1 n=1 Tax=Human papillomavirus 56 TaxID=10596 RepID=A9XCP2_HPV56|nr:putative replication protein E1 [human papillomavirus 56]